MSHPRHFNNWLTYLLTHSVSDSIGDLVIVTQWRFDFSVYNDYNDYNDFNDYNNYNDSNDRDSDLDLYLD